MEKQIDFFNGHFIFGGSFNPPTIGHVLMVKYLINEYNIKNFYILPSKSSKNKNDYIMTPADRFELIKATFSEIKNIIVLDDEFKSDGINYTVDTLRKISENNRLMKPLYFIIGMDQFNKFSSWKKPIEILNYCDIIILNRGGYNMEKNSIYELYPNKFHFIDSPVIEISSTYVRKLMKENKDIRFFVTDKTYNLLGGIHVR